MVLFGLQMQRLMASDLAASPDCGPSAVKLTLDDGSAYFVDADELAKLLSRCSVQPDAPPAPANTLEARTVLLARLLHVGKDVHSSLRGGRVPDGQTLYDMAYKLLHRLEHGTKWLVQPDDELGKACHVDAYNLFANEQINLCTDCPGAPFFLETLGVLILNSWIREACRVVVQSKEALKFISDRGRLQWLRHGVRSKDGVLCVSVALDVWMALKIAGTGSQHLPMIADGAPARMATSKDFADKQKKIDACMVFAKRFIEQALSVRYFAWLEGADNRKALTAVIAAEQPFVAEVPCAALATLLPRFRADLTAFSGMEGCTVGLLLETKTDRRNLLTVMTCMQRGGTIGNPQNAVARAAIGFHHDWSRLAIGLAGGPIDALVPFESTATSELEALFTKRGDDAFNALLHRESLLPIVVGDKYVCPSAAGGAASHATDEGEEDGVHWSEALQRMTIPSAKRPEASHATDEGEENGVHWSNALQRMTIPSAKRPDPEASRATDEGEEEGVHWSKPLQRMTMPIVQRNDEQAKKFADEKAAKLKPLLELLPMGVSAVLAECKSVLEANQSKAAKDVVGVSLLMQEVIRSLKPNRDDLQALRAFRDWTGKSELPGMSHLLRCMNGFINATEHDLGKKAKGGPRS